MRAVLIVLATIVVSLVFGGSGPDPVYDHVRLFQILALSSPKKNRDLAKYDLHVTIPTIKSIKC